MDTTTIEAVIVNSHIKGIHGNGDKGAKERGIFGNLVGA